MRLQDYPKPNNDNGRGVHWIPFTWGQVSDEHKRVTDELHAQLQEMNIRWVLILNGTGQEWQANEYLVRKLVGPDPAHPEIMPIIRIGETFDPETLEKKARGEQVGLEQARVRQIVHFYRSLGVPYFQLYNEPNHIDEWPNRIVPANAAEIVAEVWSEAALTVIDAGGLPGLAPPAPGGSWPGGDDLMMLARILDEIEARLTRAQRDRLYDKMWVGIHNYFLYHPVLSLPADSHGFKKFVWYEGIITEKVGHELPLLTGEGGLRLGPPPYGDNASEAQVAASTKEACRYMGQAPEYYFCNCFWLLGSAIGGGSDLWEPASWLRKDGSRQEVVTALKRLGEYRRAPQPPEEWFFYRNGYEVQRCHMIKGPFLQAFRSLGGLGFCGYPTSGEVDEGGVTIQGFEKLTLEKDPSGQVRVRGTAPREISVKIPTVAELLAAQGLSTLEIEQTLAEVAAIYGSPDQLVAGEYRVALPGKETWSNQDIIDAFWIAGGRTGFALMDRAGINLGDLVRDRQGPYTGEPIERLPGLSRAEIDRILAALPPLTRRVIAFRIPTVYALLEAQSLTSETLSLALKLIAEKYGPPELLPPGRYTVTLPVEPTLPVQSEYTNQEIIDAFWVAGGRSWSLMNRAGLDLGWLAANRQGVYTGPAIDDLPNLTAQEKAWIKAALPARATLMQPSGAMGAVPAGMPEIRWEAAGAGSFTKGRQGYAVDMIILHASGRGLRDTLRMADHPGGVSFHYVLDKDGTIYQCVQDGDTAHHCTLEAIDPHREAMVRPNQRSLGVALVNWGWMPREDGEMAWDPYTDEQYQSLVRLVGYLCQMHRIRRAFPPTGPATYAPAEELAYFNGILGYSALDATRLSPGPQFDWDRLRL